MSTHEAAILGAVVGFISGFLVNLLNGRKR